MYTVSSFARGASDNRRDTDANCWIVVHFAGRVQGWVFCNMSIAALPSATWACTPQSFHDLHGFLGPDLGHSLNVAVQTNEQQGTTAVTQPTQVKITDKRKLGELNTRCASNIMM